MKKCKHDTKICCYKRGYCDMFGCPNLVQPSPEPRTKIKKDCTHADTSIVVLAIVVNCETTATQCDHCGKILTKPEIDCR